MTVFEMFLTLLKQIFRGRGNYICYYLDSDRYCQINGVFDYKEDDEDTIIFW